MARLARAEVFAPDEVAVVHVMNRVVRRCFLLGDDPISGKNFDHRKVWIEEQLRLQAACFGIDLLGFALMSNHFHLILRSRPDCVAAWDDTDVARRWLTLCPVRKDEQGNAEEPDEVELNLIRNDPEKLKQIRSRLSDISWWMRILCQHIAMRANHEDKEVGRFFQSRFRAVRLLDEQAILACAAYVDLNPIRAALAESLETSPHTSIQRRIQAVEKPTKKGGDYVPQPVAKPVVAAAISTADSPGSSIQKSRKATPDRQRPDQFLAPLPLDERTGALGPVQNRDGTRCSDKGFLPMSLSDYLKLLEWTGRQIVRGKKGRIPNSVTPILQRLQLDRDTWCDLVGNFGKRFFHVAGEPTTIDTTQSRVTQHRYYLPSQTRKLFSDLNQKPATTA